MTYYGLTPLAALGFVFEYGYVGLAPAFSARSSAHDDSSTPPSGLQGIAEASGGGRR
jgi:hypothetical protein